MVDAENSPLQTKYPKWQAELKKIPSFLDQNGQNPQPFSD